LFYVGSLYFHYREAGWESRTRTSTIQLIDFKTGKPITTEPADVRIDFHDDDFAHTARTTFPSPGRVRVDWDHPCTISIQVPGYSVAGPNGEVDLDDTKPPVIQMRIDPK
jgi:hypothetical protein